MPHKKSIAVLTGGNSSEFYISLKSAETVVQSINKDRYDVYLVQIKGKEWTLMNDFNCGIVIDKSDFSFTNNGQKHRFDCVFSAIHGTPGEDGLLQAYFELQGIPIAGSGVLSSSLTFNKSYCNAFVRDTGILNVAQSVLLRKNEQFDSDKIIENLGLPCFVKPNAGGSSFGISKVKNKEDFDTAVAKAAEESDEILAEQFIEGKEIQCAVYESKKGIRPLPLVEVISKNEFFDYQAKYDPEYAEEIVPAPISDELSLKCQKIASKLYKALNMKGLVRIDFILKKNEFWFLEANTVPGMTAESIVPKMLEAEGLSFTEVLDEILEFACKKEK